MKTCNSEWVLGGQQCFSKEMGWKWGVKDEDALGCPK